MNRHVISLLAALVMTTLLPAQDGRNIMPRFPILARLDVQKELKLTTEQISKINDIISDVVKDGPNGAKVLMVSPDTDVDAMDAEITKLLNEKQRQRWKEVWLQFSGGRAFFKDEIAKEIGITKEQQGKIAELQQEFMTQMREMSLHPGEALSEERLAELKKMQKEWEAKIEKQLSKEQQVKWSAMKGVKFERTEPKSNPK